ncbi:hypothetical protein [Dokdonella soli]|uniref:Uncharacterized protein n=1 Tax=Dokdonella soli TaxID=529810 RepID=A0ABN1IUC2_9GAMM
MWWSKKKNNALATPSDVESVIHVVLATLAHMTPKYQEVFDIQAGKKRSQQQFDALNLEVTIFVLHLLDVSLFAFKGPESRSAYIPAVVDAIGVPYDEWLTERYGEASATFLSLYKAANLHYSRFKKITVDCADGVKEGTLTWEAAKEMCKAHGILDAPAVMVLVVLNQDVFIYLLSCLRTAHIISPA